MTAYTTPKEAKFVSKILHLVRIIGYQSVGKRNLKASPMDWNLL